MSLLALVLGCLSVSAAAAEPRHTLRFSSVDDRPDAVVTAVALSPDGALIAAAGDDHGVCVWNARTGEVVRRLDGHTDWVRAARFSAAGDQLATVSCDRTLRLWALDPQAKPHDCVIRMADGALQSVAFHPNAKQLVTVGFDDPLRVYNLSSGEEMNRFACSCEDTRAVAISPDGRWMAAAGRNGVVRVWDLTASGGSTDLKGDGRRVRALAFSPRGDQLAAAGDGPAVRLWSLEGGLDDAAQGPDELLIRPGKAHALAFVSAEMLAVGGASNKVQLWDTESRTRVEELRGHTGAIAALAASQDGKLLVSGAYDATVRVWELAPRGAAVATRIDSAATNR